MSHKKTAKLAIGARLVEGFLKDGYSLVAAFLSVTRSLTATECLTLWTAAFATTRPPAGPSDRSLEVHNSATNSAKSASHVSPVRHSISGVSYVSIGDISFQRRAL